MHRTSIAVFALALAGCVQEGLGLNAPPIDTSSTPAPRRGRHDAGATTDALAPPDALALVDTTPRPDTLVQPDSGVQVDTRPADALVVRDMLAQPDLAPEARGFDVTPASDAFALPDGLSYPHDIVTTDFGASTRACLQAVIANGYASGEGSCAQLANGGDAGLAAAEACRATIDCYVTTDAPRCLYAGEPYWIGDHACPCAVIWAAAGAGAYEMAKIVRPFCDGFI
jgi:hypothetical protein